MHSGTDRLRSVPELPGTSDSRGASRLLAGGQDIDSRPVRRTFSGHGPLSRRERPSHGLIRLPEVLDSKVNGLEVLESEAPFDLCVGQFLLDFSEAAFDTPHACVGMIHGGVRWRGSGNAAGTPLYPNAAAASKRAHAPKDLPRRVSGSILRNGTLS